jgi:hypothetical protein
MNLAYQNETQAPFITNLDMFRSVSLVAIVCLTNYFVQLEFAYLVIEREMIKKE